MIGCMEVVIYTSNGCTSCQRAKTFLRERQIAFVERNLSTDPAAMNELIRLGCRQLPVIIMGDRRCEGFIPDELVRLVGL